MIRFAYSFFPGITAVIVFLFLARAQTTTVYLSIALLWMVLTFLFYRYVSRFVSVDRIDASLFWSLLLGAVCFFSVLETASARLFLMWFIGFLVGTLFALLLYHDLPHHVIQRPFRRIRLMLWVWTLYMWVTSLFAFHVYFQSVPFVFFLILIAGIAVYTAYMAWSLYFSFSVKQATLWLLFLGLIFVELCWVIRVLPFDYVVSGFFVTWIWYIVQLFIRFHLSPRGIIWRRQATFLGICAGMFLLLLAFFVRWV